MLINTSGMNKKSESLLQQIAQIQQMERGKLSVMREGPQGPYFKLQRWENGKNVSRYVPRDQAPAVQEAVAGYKQFQEVAEHYAEEIIQQTRTEIAANSKKKRSSRPNSSWPKTPKSNS